MQTNGEDMIISGKLNEAFINGNPIREWDKKVKVEFQIWI
jgi:hypothetical protein